MVEWLIDSVCGGAKIEVRRSAVCEWEAVVVVREGSVVCNATATTEFYTLSLHDALPIYLRIVAVPFAVITRNLAAFKLVLDRGG